MRVLLLVLLAASSAAAQVPSQHTVFDRFVAGSWDAAGLPPFGDTDLRQAAKSLQAEAGSWIEAGGEHHVTARRLQVAAFVLEFLYTQSAPQHWEHAGPASDLVQWASGLLRKGTPSDGERLWRLAALALLQRAGASAFGNEVAFAYSRFPREPHFVLARGLAEEQGTWPQLREETEFRISPAKLVQLTERYEATLAFSSVAAEASIRLAFLELRRGRPAEALARLDQAGIPDDRWLRYLRFLFEGQAHERRNDLVAAERAFGRAVDAVPLAQSAILARGAVQARLGQARAAAAQVQRLLEVRDSVEDPWTSFVTSEWRHWPHRRAALAAVIRP